MSETESPTGAEYTRPVSKFRTEMVIVPKEVPVLTKADIVNGLNALPSDEKEAIATDNPALLCFALTRSDQWGRPLKTTGMELITLLSEITQKGWNMIFTKAATALDKKLADPNNTSAAADVFAQYLRRQKLFESASEAKLFVITPTRYSNEKQVYELLRQKAQDAERIKMLSQLKPPEDYDEWPNAVMETVAAIKAGLINLPDAQLSPANLLPVNLMLAELTHAEALQGKERSTLLAEVRGYNWLVNFGDGSPLMVERVMNALNYKGKYDPSQDEQDRFMFCVKTLIASHNPYYRSHPENLSPAEKTALKANSDERARELIAWIARGGYDAEPAWFHSKTNGNGHGPKGKREVTTPVIHEYVKELPRIQRSNIKFYYADGPADIPDDMNDFDPKSPKYVAVRYDTVDHFNTDLSEIFGNPNSDMGRGGYAARAVLKVLQNPDELRQAPRTNDIGFKHLRKLDVTGQDVAVHGLWTTKWAEGEDQIIVITATHKNKRMKRTR